MKKSILELKGAVVLTMNNQKLIVGGHGGPSFGSGHPYICGRNGFPPCQQN